MRSPDPPSLPPRVRGAMRFDLDSPRTPPPATPGADPRQIVDWLVVGGGVHGSHLAARLLDDPAAGAGSLRILDPHPTPMARWRTTTARIGMSHLRSPVVHHVGIDPLELARFGDRRPGRAGVARFRGPNRRPALELFNDHAQSVAERFDLSRRWIPRACERLRRDPTGLWLVEWADGGIAARNVVLAIGASDRPHWPDWARELARVADRHAVSHLLDPAPGGTHLLDPAPDGTPLLGPALPGDPDLVVGAGMTGAHAALKLAAAGRQVVLISRNPLRVARYDTEPGWLGPRYMRAFRELEDYGDRRRIIAEARRTGTVNEDVASALRAAERRGEVELVQGEVLGAARDGRCVLATLRPGGGPASEEGSTPVVRRFARVFLGTGLGTRRPGGRWLDESCGAEGLPTAPCGFPIVGAGLDWAPGLYATGALGELELGPVARNLAGARRAGDRIVKHVAALTAA